MFTTDPKILQTMTTPNRLWQGIPGIEVTPGGRIFSTFYSGGITEMIGNYVLVLCSEGGAPFSEPIAAAVPDETHRFFDPCLWIDPLGRLWLFWAQQPDDGLFAVICDDPDAPVLEWGPVRRIGTGVMMNRPTVLSTGEWLFPVAIWEKPTRQILYGTSEDLPEGSYAVKSVDNGETFVPLGVADVAKRSFDEHMILEKNDGSLDMYVRTTYGIGVSHSWDRGKTWTPGEDTGWGGPCSRFFIRRLRSGRLLLINHHRYTGRSHLTALLSEDDGQTWPYTLLLDERSNVSYPDAVEAADGFIYVTYDRERGAAYQPSVFRTVYAQAREILFARITEADILRGQLGPDSALKQVISKLGRYAHEDRNPYQEPQLYSDRELARKLLAENKPDTLCSAVFNVCPLNCITMHRLDARLLDEKFTALEQEGCDQEQILTDILTLIRAANTPDAEVLPQVVQRIRTWILQNLTEEFTVRELAEAMDLSVYYVCHLFRSATGTTVGNYRNAMRLSKAKSLLISGKDPITHIAIACGFNNSSYFTKVFTREEGLSPSEYRKLHAR